MAKGCAVDERRPQVHMFQDLGAKRGKARQEFKSKYEKCLQHLEEDSQFRHLQRA